MVDKKQQPQTKAKYLFIMSLIIYKKIDDSYLDETLVRWKLLAKVKFRSLRAYVLITALYLVIAISRYINYGIFWTFWMSFGIAFLFLMLVSALELYKGRSEWISKAKRCIQKYSTRIPEIEYTFSDQMITGKDIESYFELKWTAFSNYQVYENYLLFYLTDSNSAGVTLDKSKIPADIYAELITLTKSKLIEKK